VESVRYLLDQGVDPTDRSGYLARTLRNGHDGIFTLLMDHRREHRTELPVLSIFRATAGTGNFEVVEYLLEMGCRISLEYILEAVQNNQTKMVKHLLEASVENHSINPRLFDEVVRYGNVNLVHYLFEHGLDRRYLDVGVYRASQYRQFDVIKTLLQMGATVHYAKDRSLINRVQHGDIEMVKFLLDFGASISPDLLREASERGYQEILDLLKSRLTAPPTLIQQIFNWFSNPL
jgi:ankyrin repeat protein